MTRQWFRRRASTLNPQTLTSRQIYILPSAFGWLYGLTLAGIGSGAINYQLNPAWFLFFLMMVIGFWSMWQSHDNLKNLSIQCLPVPNTEQGQPVRVTLLLRSKNRQKHALHFCFPNAEPVTLDTVPANGINIVLPLATSRRGKFKLPPIKVNTRFPSSIFYVWSWLYFDVDYLVYPAPLSPGFWPNTDSTLYRDLAQHVNTGYEEFDELKDIENPWVQPGRIAWKISARGQGWFLKSTSSPAGENWLFRLEDLPKQDIELSLQQLSFWIQTAEQGKQSYGLELKGLRTAISHGEDHLKYCLEQLAVY